MRNYHAQLRTPPANTGSGTITLTSPSAYQVFQRRGTVGGIYVSGTYTGTLGAVEASFNGERYKTIDPAPGGGVFGGMLTQQPQGQGTLTVRWLGAGGDPVTVSYVGVGEVWALIGQSNNVGAGDSALSYSHTTLKASVFNNDYLVNELGGSLDDGTDQVDSVSYDATSIGHWGIPCSSTMLTNLGVPVMWVPCALGGSQVSDWAVPTNPLDRTTLLGSALYRMRYLPGGVRAALCWLGETNAVNGTTEATFETGLNNMVNAIWTYAGVKTLLAKIEILDDDPWIASTTNVNNAIGDVITSNDYALAGPDFSSTNWTGRTTTARNRPRLLRRPGGRRLMRWQTPKGGGRWLAR